ncbi:hypothetical protein BN1708_001602 [Verticillium longisporum]|uniref:Zn(2)-C6 fungal-type domain-containing protein n=1 Tax=Verticillium longisporum TaxID=100787 RepID=A0A0G4MYV3_VERLO|nr:hypothetical protein BN1708_001602 [Verticillium longisporum]
MLAGPFDLRTRRSRCTQCVKSHSKCSGSTPCTSCLKRKLTCVFPSQTTAKRGKAITLDQGKHLTQITFAVSSSSSSSSTSPVVFTPSPSPALPDPTAHALSLFTAFIARNSFTGQPMTYLADLPPLLSPSSPLLPALHALANLQLRRPRPALEAYGTAIVSLRHTLASAPAASVPASGASTPTSAADAMRTTVLWTTFLLGLFELMTDASGAGWVQHMVHGTARALVALGPAACSARSSSAVGRFFLQVRAFEACRAAIFNEVSFLGEDSWRAVVGGQTEEDAVLDVIVRCSGLRVRTSDFIENLTDPPSPSETLTALTLAEEGATLRATLEAAPSRSLLTRLLVAATSIYLSGNYDYDLPAWRGLGVAVPTLPAPTVKTHCETIVACAREALKERSLSPLLLLYPLRVAGARAWTVEEQVLVDGLLTEVGREFVVAEAFLGELREIWLVRNEMAALVGAGVA